MLIAEQLSALSEVSGIKLGNGPRHSTAANPLYVELLIDHLSHNGFLANHHDFVQFLECYAGAQILQHEESGSPWWYTTIFGIGQWEQSEMAPAVDSDGFYVFATVSTGSSEQSSVHDLQAAFAFDATGKRTRAVYAAVGPVDDWIPGNYRVYCDSFDEWLRRLIKADGRLMPACQEDERAVAEVGSIGGN